MSDFFIIDEWIWADLKGENGGRKQKEAFSFLEILYGKCDKIVVAKDSKFQQKEKEFSSIANQSDIKRHGIMGFYSKYIRLNSQKYKEVNINDEKETGLEGINRDDIYIVKTYNKAKTEYETQPTVITTDEELMNNLQSMNIPTKSRDAFLHEYLSGMEERN